MMQAKVPLQSLATTVYADLGVFQMVCMQWSRWSDARRAWCATVVRVHAAMWSVQPVLPKKKGMQRWRLELQPSVWKTEILPVELTLREKARGVFFCNAGESNSNRFVGNEAFYH